MRALGRVLQEALETSRVVALALAHLALGKVDGFLRGVRGEREADRRRTLQTGQV